ncbi:uncharacterized protein LOC111071710 [Drosophila obscura]|uniref:uncharacterized protein LOC111071710 n=1 Tax=Drosophila obscura TaxID=7282 RepID=UPI001BB0EB70|nr:uncharacterized protein LOC111071710 [Drosophila obscura]
MVGRWQSAGQFTSATERKRFHRSRSRTRNPNQIHHKMKIVQSMGIMMVMVMLLLLPLCLARPQEFVFQGDTSPGTEAERRPLPLNDPSDLSAGLNLLPISNLIAAAANSVLPAPVQFIRTAMNSGL